MARRINMPGEPGPFGSARSPAYLLLGARNISSDCFPRKECLCSGSAMYWIAHGFPKRLCHRKKLMLYFLKFRRNNQ